MCRSLVRRFRSVWYLLCIHDIHDDTALQHLSETGFDGEAVVDGRGGVSSIGGTPAIHGVVVVHSHCEEIRRRADIYE